VSQPAGARLGDAEPAAEHPDQQLLRSSAVVEVDHQREQRQPSEEQAHSQRLETLDERPAPRALYEGGLVVKIVD